MHKKALLILAGCLVIIVAASLITWHYFTPQETSKYEKNINRNFNSQQEENALKAAEAINYSNITSLNRFQDSSNPEDYRNPRTYLDYTYAHFIDSEVINYYETRYDDLHGVIGPKYPKGITFTYQANASEYSNFRIYNSPAPQGATWHNITIVKSTPNGLVKFDSGSMQFFYKNQSSYQMTQWNYSFNFTDCYVVEMSLMYSEYYAPLAAFISDVYQIVVLDQNLTPVLVGVECRGVVA